VSTNQIIRASEIGEYVYCHRAWWLHRVKGIESANREQMQAGNAQHFAHGRAVQQSVSLFRFGFVLVLLALIFGTLFFLSVLAR
jgi:CRISPR/Cas system-associated exonuclease Cas4 (RecB family)